MGARRQRLTPSGVVIQSVNDASRRGGDVRAAVWSRLLSQQESVQATRLPTPKRGSPQGKWLSCSWFARDRVCAREQQRTIFTRSPELSGSDSQLKNMSGEVQKSSLSKLRHNATKLARDDDDDDGIGTHTGGRIR